MKGFIEKYNYNHTFPIFFMTNYTVQKLMIAWSENINENKAGKEDNGPIIPYVDH